MANKYTIAAKTGESAVREMLITALDTSDSTTAKWSAMGVKVHSGARVHERTDTRNDTELFRQ